VVASGGCGKKFEKEKEKKFSENSVHTFFSESTKRKRKIKIKFAFMKICYKHQKFVLSL
jgi:hypothetical protein